nr:hypothetical protein [Acidobacteriota bacterium]
PGLGQVPVNALVVVGFAVFGFVHPGFWVLGGGLEVGYLVLLAGNPRFQRLVDARRRVLAAGEAEQRREDLVRKLTPEARQRYNALEERCARSLQVSQESQAPDFALESSRDALSRLSWVYLKLLMARFHLDSSRIGTSESDLKQKIAALKSTLSSADLTAALRESQSATLKILEQRLENLERSQQTVREVDSDLARIEAQVDLALENANLRGSGAVVSANLDLASQILDDGLYYGDAEKDVVALDEVYSVPPKMRTR